MFIVPVLPSLIFKLSPSKSASFDPFTREYFHFGYFVFARTNIFNYTNLQRGDWMPSFHGNIYLKDKGTRNSPWLPPVLSLRRPRGVKCNDEKVDKCVNNAWTIKSSKFAINNFHWYYKEYIITVFLQEQWGLETYNKNDSLTCLLAQAHLQMNISTDHSYYTIPRMLLLRS